MLKAVVDTNQFVSAVINAQGASAELLDAWRKQRYVLVTSKEILEEIFKVFNYPKIVRNYKLNKSEIIQLMALIEREAVVLKDVKAVNIVKSDPDDNKFLACALEAHADCIVTGDENLLSLQQYRGIRIMRVRAFLRLLETENQAD